MATKRKKKTAGSKGRKPTQKAKNAYYKNIEKSYRRLHAVLKQHNPSVISSVRS